MIRRHQRTAARRVVGGHDGTQAGESGFLKTARGLDVRFAAAVGAVFDFYTGNVTRSHPIFQRLGLEWLPRLLQQPRRLWRRMLVSAPIFVWHTLKARVAAIEWIATLRSR